MKPRGDVLARSHGARRTALDGLRMYRRSALLFALIAAAATSVTLPVAWLSGAGSALAPRLKLTVTGSYLSAVPELAGSPTATQHGAVTLFFQILLAALLAVLLVAGLAGLSLAATRTAARTPELNLRRAVGASRRTLALAALLEGAGVAVAGLVLGGPIGAGIMLLAAAAWPGSITPGSYTLLAIVVLLIALGAVLGALLPVWFARRHRLADDSAPPVQLAIPILLLGLSLIVLVSASLLGRYAGTFLPNGGVAGGAGEVFELAVDPAPSGEPPHAALLAGLASDSTLALVSLTNPGGALGLGQVQMVTTDCGNCADGGIPTKFRPIRATQFLASSDTFRALGTPVLQGRGFTVEDQSGATPVAIVSRSLAQRGFQQGNPLGRELSIRRGQTGARDWYTVVGVVEDLRPVAFGGGLQPAEAVYFSVLQRPQPAVELLVRPVSAGIPARPIEGSIRQAMGTAPVRLTRHSEAQIYASQRGTTAWFGRGFVLFGWTMLLLAIGATVVVMRAWTVSILCELGLRRAVGARRRGLLGGVVARALLVGLAGIAVAMVFGPPIWDGLSQALGRQIEWQTEVVARFGLLLVAGALAGVLLPLRQAAVASPAALLETVVD